MNPRDLEHLSAYLDGQLTPGELAVMESRLQQEAVLRQSLAELRSTRDLLRRLPSRKAPRNFVLSKTAVRRNPPLPHGFSMLRFASATAALLFLVFVSANTLAPLMSPAASVPVLGMGGGGGDEPFAAAPSEPSALGAPAPEMPAGTPTPLAAQERMAATPELEMEAADSQSAPEPAVPSRPPVVPRPWVIAAGGTALSFALAALLMRLAAASKWR